LGQLSAELVPEPVDVVTIDPSYLSLAAAAPQLLVLDFAPAADLIALVKPVYELGLATLPEDGRVIAAAVRHAADGLKTAGWLVRAAEARQSGVRGAADDIGNCSSARVCALRRDVSAVESVRSWAPRPAPRAAARAT
jgi:predicted rRNA methylase YqxC with S4 and FtsJ domains